MRVHQDKVDSCALRWMVGKPLPAVNEVIIPETFMMMSITHVADGSRVPGKPQSIIHQIHGAKRVAYKIPLEPRRSPGETFQ